MMNICKLFLNIALAMMISGICLAGTHPKIQHGQHCSDCHATPPDGDLPPDSLLPAKNVHGTTATTPKLTPSSKPKLVAKPVVKSEQPKPAQDISAVKSEKVVQTTPAIAVPSAQLSTTRPQNKPRYSLAIWISIIILMLGSLVLVLRRKIKLR